MPRSTLFTSPPSQLDFLARLLFFASAPFLIVLATALFPVIGALVSIGVAIVVSLAGETVRAWAASSVVVRVLLKRELAFEEFYRTRAPRSFAYYVFYPLLFPYWLTNREARREFWLFKGYTALSLFILLASVLYQYLHNWRPELGWRAYLPVVGMTLAIETLLVLSALMPLATTIIAFHQSHRRGRLVVLLLVALASTSIAVGRMVHRRDPIVSYATRIRILLRSRARAARSHEVRVAAAKAALRMLNDAPAAVEGDGKIEGEPLDRARELLGSYYKPDEAFGFDLWASPRTKPKYLVLYSEARPGADPIWTALSQRGAEVTDPKALPRGAFVAMKHAAEE